MRRAIVLLAAASLLVAGCGGGGGDKSSGSGKPLTKAAYQAKLESIAKEVGAKLKGATSAAKKPTKKDLEVTKKALKQFADELEAVTPPAEVKNAHANLVAAMRRLRDDIEGIFEKIDKAKDPSAAISALLGAPAIQLLVKAQQEFNAKGYKLNLSG